MVQGSLRKPSAGKPGKMKRNGAKQKQMVAKKKAVKKGAPLQLPKSTNKRFYNDYVDEHVLSRAIAKANEQKVAAKLLQSGSKLVMKDLVDKGKELNRETRRDKLKKKVSRVEEKIQKIRAKQER